MDKETKMAYLIEELVRNLDRIATVLEEVHRPATGEYDSYIRVKQY